ncbi:MAG: hypothetical protein ACI9Y8_001440, partial [Candidatus Omnitrophota bacterium]
EPLHVRECIVSIKLTTKMSYNKFTNIKPTLFNQYAHCELRVAGTRQSGVKIDARR